MNIKLGFPKRKLKEIYINFASKPPYPWEVYYRRKYWFISIAKTKYIGIPHTGNIKVDIHHIYLKILNRWILIRREIQS